MISGREYWSKISWLLHTMYTKNWDKRKMIGNLESEMSSHPSTEQRQVVLHTSARICWPEMCASIVGQSPSYHSPMIIKLLVLYTCSLNNLTMSFLQCLFIYLLFKHLYWSKMALQWCVSFCFITKWISYTYTYIPISLPSCVSLSPTLPIPPL